MYVKDQSKELKKSNPTITYTQHRQQID